MTAKTAQILVVAPHPDDAEFQFFFDSHIGPISLTASVKGLCTLTLSPQPAPAAKEQLLPRFAGLIERLKTYFDGRKVTFPDKLDLSTATPFQRRVWETTRLIPYGETRSYRWVAEQIGQPKAVRAVGNALARNPLPVIIPCHRVVAGDGNLGGFSYGLEMKQKLLRLEQPKTTSIREARSPII